MKIFIKKPTGYFPYGNGYFKKYLEELLISFGFGENEYKVESSHNLTLDGGRVEGYILILDENKREGKNIDDLLEEISKYKKIFQMGNEEKSLWDGKKISRYQLRFSQFV
ncbi:hypothetical protein J7J74_02490 [bacterium]|nr:hypothetical protein [bacterium]